MNAKEAAARRAVEAVLSGMTVGLGTGSTAVFAIQAIGERIRKEGLVLRGVPTSKRSEDLAREIGIPLVDFSQVETIDITIDGADEVDSELNLIKGGGGALVQEKIVASVSRQLVIICDKSKVKPTLGAFPLPIAIIRFGWQATLRKLNAFGHPIVLRRNADGSPFTSDDGLYIADMHCGQISDPRKRESEIKAITGVAEVGLFVGVATCVIVGYEDGSAESRLKRP